MAGRLPSGRARQPSTPSARIDARALACGLVVVLLAVLPALFSPRGQNAFGVVKSGVLQVFGVLAGIAAALALWSERRRPPLCALSIAAASVVALFALATVFGIAPVLSFFAPDARHEGTDVLLALAAVGFAVSTFDAAQIEAVILAIVIGSIGPSLYAISQTVVAVSSATSGAPVVRAGGTLGNAVLLGGYLATVIPITAAVAIARRRHAVWWIVLALQIAALAGARARGATLAALAALVVFSAALVDLDTRRRRAIAALVTATLIVCAIGGVLLFRARYGAKAVGQTLQVREIIWRDVVRTIGAHPERLALGSGPGRLQVLVAPHQSPRLALLEGGFAVPDRAHNELLDAIVDAGLLGAAAVIALHILLWGQLARLIWGQVGVRRVSDASLTRWLAIGLLASAIATSSTSRPASRR
jgi:O-antigen ligase